MRSRQRAISELFRLRRAEVNTRQFWVDVVRTAKINMQRRGMVFRDGVESAAVSAVLKVKPAEKEAQIDAVEFVMMLYYDIAPRWDGSIA